MDIESSMDGNDSKLAIINYICVPIKSLSTFSIDNINCKSSITNLQVYI